LVDGRIMTLQELAGRCALLDDSTRQGIQSARLLFRHIVDFELPIYEKEKPALLGNVLDITEGGVGLKGIEATIGESKNFVIPAKKVFGVGRVEFRAQCRWVNREESTGECMGGFEITSISSRASVELAKSVQLTELQNQVEVVEYAEPSPEKTDRREEPRYAAGFSLPIHEARKRENKGMIVDVGEGGIGIKGLSAEPGERKKLVIPAYSYYGFVTFESIVIVAECRWTEVDEETGERKSGFKVLQLTPRNAMELGKLISCLVLSKRPI